MKFTIRAMKTYPAAQTLGFFDVELRVRWLLLPRTAAWKALIKTRNDRKPINDKGSNVMKIQTEGAAMKSSTPKTEASGILTFYMGKNTPERKDYIMERLVVPVED
jgi:hypothetical protein